MNDFDLYIGRGFGLPNPSPFVTKLDMLCDWGGGQWIRTGHFGKKATTLALRQPCARAAKRLSKRLGSKIRY